MVLAFRVVPINEVVKVKGVVYTRTGSSSMAKAVCNVDEFVKQRRTLKLDSTPKKPEFPVFFSEERKEYIFKVQQDSNVQQEIFLLPEVEVKEETVLPPMRREKLKTKRMRAKHPVCERTP